MTGFGSATEEIDGARYTVEIRGVNSKYFKAQVRVPEDLLALEAEIESALSRRIGRGSLTATIRHLAGTTEGSVTVNSELMSRIVSSIESSVPQGNDSRHTIDLAKLLDIPGVLAHEPVEAVVDRARPAVLKVIGSACDALIAMREREGELLRADLKGLLESIGSRLAIVAERAPLVVEHYQERLRQRMTTLLEEVGASVQNEDLLKEVAVYAERTDISEEVVRLGGHLEQFGQLIEGASPDPVGRTLDFLAQEMLREANTIASKSADSEISRNIVEIKGLIDRIKEQSANAE
tara:strand:- start:401 stop:1279 length:879 start_codon:yes stop_codon:yes gene_type:complete